MMHNHHDSIFPQVPQVPQVPQGEYREMVGRSRQIAGRWPGDAGWLERGLNSTRLVLMAWVRVIEDDRAYCVQWGGASKLVC